MLFLLLYTGFLLFDYHPEQESKTTVIRFYVAGKPDFVKVTITELLIIICINVFLFGEIREVIKSLKNVFNHKKETFKMQFILVPSNKVVQFKNKAKALFHRKQMEHIRFDIVLVVLSCGIRAVFDAVRPGLVFGQ